MSDLRIALRQLARNPVFHGIAILVLALGIGANSAMFSLINALLLRPITAESPTELVGIYSREDKPEGGYRAFSYPNYLDIRKAREVFSEVAAYTLAMVGTREGEVTRRSFAAMVSANYLRTFGLRPALGRDFTAEEEADAGASVAMVSDAWWRRTGADPEILGRTLNLNGLPFTIVAVAPPGFTGTTALFSPDLWVPLGAGARIANDFTARTSQNLQDRAQHQYLLMGRLRPGVTLETARARLQPVAHQLATAYPAENKDRTLELHPLPRLSISTSPQNNNPLRTLAALLLPMSGVVLLVACLNLANMLLARATTRRREMAVRLALGGTRTRIVRQLLTEALLLSLLGGAGGLALAWSVPQLLASSLAGRLPGMTLVLHATPDLRVIAFTVAVCLVATVLFAFVPALRLARADLVHDLKEGPSPEPAASSRFALLTPRNLLVSAQLALSLTLLTVAFLFYRGARNAATADPGFAFDDNLLVEMDPSLAGLDEPSGRPLYQEVLRRVRALPGVSSASLVSVVPFGMFYDTRSVRPVGGFPDSATRSAGASAGTPAVGVRRSDADRLNPDREDSVAAGFVIASHGYFQTVGLPLLRGRDFDALEESESTTAPVAIIDEAFARRLWGDEDPIGRQFELVERDRSGSPQVFGVIGVVAPVRQELGDPEPGARFYVPTGRSYQGWMNLHVRLANPTPGEAALMLRHVREELNRVDSRLPVLSMNTLRSFHDRGVAVWAFRTGSRLFGTFALLALFLSAVGVYAVRAYLVARRTREIGIRVALGAPRAQVVTMVLREGLLLTATGLGIGLCLSLAAGRLLGSRLYQVNWADPTSLGAALLLLGGAALLACWLPARRAASIDPTEALRCE